MTSDSVFMEHTKISAKQTAGQIAGLLMEAGASSITQENESGQIRGIAFTLDVDGKRLGYRLPVRTELLYAELQRRRSDRTREKAADDDLKKSERIAWRQIFRWVEAQLALIQTSMVSPTEVFLPYMLVSPRQTLFDKFLADGKKLLAAAKVEVER